MLQPDHVPVLSKQKKMFLLQFAVKSFNEQIPLAHILSTAGLKKWWLYLISYNFLLYAEISFLD